MVSSHQVFWPKFCTQFSCLPHVNYMLCPSHPPRFDVTEHLVTSKNIMKLNVAHFSLVSLVTLCWIQISPQYPVPKHYQSICFSLRVRDHGNSVHSFLLVFEFLNIINCKWIWLIYNYLLWEPDSMCCLMTVWYCTFGLWVVWWK